MVPGGGVGVELEDGQEFYGGDAELAEVGDFFHEPRVGAAGFLADAGSGRASKAANVHFVDDGSGGRVADREVPLPVVGGEIRDHAFHCVRRIVAGFRSGLAAVASRHGDGTPVGIQKDFVGIETRAGCGIRCSLHAIGINLAGLHARHEDMPVVIDARRGIDAHAARRAGIINVVEEEQFHAGGVAREKPEFRAALDERGTECRTGHGRGCSGF